MDKKTIMAMVLIALIIILMPYYQKILGIKQPEPKPQIVETVRKDSLQYQVQEKEEIATS